MLFPLSWLNCRLAQLDWFAVNITRLGVDTTITLLLSLEDKSESFQVKSFQLSQLLD
ncbi:MAG: hypothetical protein ACLGGO_19215 [Coleofasciculus sp.]